MDNFFNDVPEYKHFLSHPLNEKIVALREANFKYHKEFDYAPENYTDALDNYEQILAIIGEICATTIAPNAEGVDIEGPHIVNNGVKYAKGTQENYDKLKEAGVIGLALPYKYGGLNFPMVPYVIAAEMVSRADAGFANIWGLQDCAETIYEFGSEEIKAEYLPRFTEEGITAAMVLTEPDAGSDLQAVQLKATYDEAKDQWYLNGVKRFITNGDADVSLVLARSEEGTSDARGLSLFIYEKENQAVEVRHLEKKLGIKGSPTCELVFKNAPAKLVGQQRMGLIKYVMSLMNAARLGVGAQSVGISEAAYREAYKYAQEREQFDKPIIEFAPIRELLVNMRTRTDAIRSLLYETTRFVDMTKLYEDIMKERRLEGDERKEMKHYKRLAGVFTPLIKLIGSEYSNSITYDSLQVHGGTGFMKDFPIERLYRDARITSIYEGTSQLQVVAAIKGVITKVYLQQIKSYETQVTDAGFAGLKEILISMTAEYEAAHAKVDEADNNELLDFHARRLVEMAGNIIMGYLLILDAQRNKERFAHSAKVFVELARAENKDKAAYIDRMGVENLALYARK